MGHPKRLGAPLEPHLGEAASLCWDHKDVPCADLGWLRLALVGWGQNCANDIDNQVPVSVLGTCLIY